MDIILNKEADITIDQPSSFSVYPEGYNDTITSFLQYECTNRNTINGNSSDTTILFSLSNRGKTTLSLSPTITTSLIYIPGNYQIRYNVTCNV